MMTTKNGDLFSSATMRPTFGNIIGILIVASLLAIWVFSYVEAAVPQFVNYQSRLRDSSSNAITATTIIQFSIYNHATNGAPTDTATSTGPLLWTETHDQASGSCAYVDPDDEGYFTTQLGTCVSFPSYLNFTSDTLYVGVKISSDAEAAPRARLGTAPYAFNAEAVGGITASSILRNDQAGTVSATSTNTLFSLVQSGTGDILNIFDGLVEIFTILDGGNVGIGTASPSSTVHIAPSSAAALQIDPFGSSAGNTGELRLVELSANGTNYVGLKAPDSVATSTIWVLPNADGSANQVLTTDGSGSLSFAASDALIADDSLDFTEFADSLTLDASTTVAFGTSDFIFNLDSSGDFILQDASSTFVTFGNDGTTTFANDLTINGGVSYRYISLRCGGSGYCQRIVYCSVSGGGSHI